MVDLLKHRDLYLSERNMDFQREQLQILEERLKENQFVFMTVEERTKGKLELISFPVDTIEYKSMYNIEFYYNMEQVYLYDGQKNLWFYLSPIQNESYDLLKQNSTRYSYDALKDFVDYAYTDYYGVAQRFLATGMDIESTADLLYMDKVSRNKLHEAVIRKKMDNFQEKYGYPNKLLEVQLKELMGVDL